MGVNAAGAVRVGCCGRGVLVATGVRAARDDGLRAGAAVREAAGAACDTAGAAADAW